MAWFSCLILSINKFFLIYYIRLTGTKRTCREWKEGDGIEKFEKHCSRGKLLLAKTLHITNVQHYENLKCNKRFPSNRSYFIPTLLSLKVFRPKTINIHPTFSQTSLLYPVVILVICRNLWTCSYQLKLDFCHALSHATPIVSRLDYGWPRLLSAPVA